MPPEAEAAAADAAQDAAETSDSTDTSAEATDKSAATTDDKSGDASDDAKPSKGLTGDALDNQDKADDNADKSTDLSLNIKLDARPKGIPEQFFNEETKELTIDSLIKGWKDRGTEIKDLRAKKADILPPEKAEDYKFDVPEDANYKLENAQDDPGFGIWRNVAHKHNLTQEQFQGVLNDFLSDAQASGIGTVPDINTDEELAKLGPEGGKMVEFYANKGQELRDQGLFSEDDQQEFNIATATASGVKMMHNLFQSMVGSQGIPAGGDFKTAEGTMTDKELYAAIGSTRYHTDEAYREKIDAESAKAWGNAPAGESKRGLVHVEPGKQSIPANKNT